jgi:alkylresorcinol/alkylpyrone synthase
VQNEILDQLSRTWGARLENPASLARLHARVGVANRSLVMPLEEYHVAQPWGITNDRWIDEAQNLAENALTAALARAELDTAAISALYFTSVTGICSPSIDARLMNRMRLPAGVKRMPSFGLGCVGGAACLARAADYLLGHPRDVAVVLAVEICSLTIQQDDMSVANLISTGLFGDGAAAVLLVGAEVEIAGPTVLATRSVFYPDSEKVMGWDISEKGFTIRLSPGVPDLIRTRIRNDVDAFLAESDVARSDIDQWVLHTGGPSVLEAMAEGLEITRDQMAASWECLREMGNLSSASVLAVLEKIVVERRPEPGSLGLIGAMGPGFCAEFLLVRW